MQAVYEFVAGISDEVKLDIWNLEGQTDGQMENKI